MDQRVISTDGQYHRRSSFKDLGKTQPLEGLMERLVEFKDCAWDPFPRVIEQLSRKKPTRCSALPRVLTVLYPLTSYVLHLRAALASISLGSVSIAFVARFRTAANSNALAHVLAKIRAAREFHGASICALTSELKSFLKTSMGHNTMKVFEYVRHLDHAGRIADSQW